MTRRPFLLLAFLLPFSAILAAPPESSAPPLADNPDAHRARRADPFPLIVDHKAQARIETAQDLLDRGRVDAAYRLLQQVIDSDDEPFVHVAPEKIGASPMEIVPAKIQAQRMLLLHPEAYQKLYGKDAAALLAQGNWDKPGIGKFAEIGSRYPATDAAGVALRQLAVRSFDAGDMETAACLFTRLADLPTEKDAAYLFRVAVALEAVGAWEDASQARLNFQVELGKDSFVWDNRNLTKAEAKDERDKLVERFKSRPLTDWRVFGGSASRSRQASGGAPLLAVVDWTSPVLLPSAYQTLVEGTEDRVIKHDKPILPSVQPIGVTVTRRDGKSIETVVVRNTSGTYAVELATGRRLWEALAERSPERMLRTSTVEKSEEWADFRKTLDDYRQRGWEHMLWENSLAASISADETSVYMIDDFVLLPVPWDKHPLAVPNAEKDTKKTDYALCNQMKSFDLRSGKILRVIGGDEDSKMPQPPDLLGGFFLGAPLPLDGRLYVLREKNHEIQLLCLDAKVDPQKADPVLWKQVLCEVESSAMFDTFRRTQAAPISASGNVLVCQTNAGAIVAVDALTHRILWAKTYPRTKLLRDFDPNKPPADPLGWRASAPIIAGNTVVVAPADADSLFCLDLWTGGERWQHPRQDDELYVAGVFSGYGDRVVVVGRDIVTAYRLGSGKRDWKLATDGMPSGVGVAAGKTYYLPLRYTKDEKLPQICAIDVETGKVAQRIKSIRGDVPGNLIFFHDMLISQNLHDVTAYPPFELKLAEVTRLLKDNPKDPVALYRRAMIRLSQSDSTGAVADLREALRNKPDEERVETIRQRWHETLGSLLTTDFKAHEDLLKDFLDSCESTDKAEKAGRLWTYHLVLAEGRRQQGKLDDALEAALKLAGLIDPEDLITAKGDGDRKVAPAASARAQVDAILEAANDTERPKLIKQLETTWNDAKDSKDKDRMRKFVRLVGPATELGASARLHLAAVLARTAAPAEVESLLLQVRARADAEYAEQAAGALAVFMVQNGLPQEALHFLSPGRATPNWNSNAKLEGMKETGKFEVPPRFTADVRGERLPLFRSRHLQVDAATGKIMIDEAGKKGALKLGKLDTFRDTAFGDFPCFSNGHMLVLAYGTTVAAVDMVQERLLWQYYLPDPGHKEVAVRKSGPGDDGVYRITYDNGWTQRLDHNVLVEKAYVAFLDVNGLTAVDAVTGKVQWSRRDIAAGSVLFGDADYVFVSELNKEGQTEGVNCFRASDGSRVAVEGVGRHDHFDDRVHIIGRNILANTKGPKGEEVLELFDMLTAKIIWSKDFPAQSILLKTDNPALTGMVDLEGHVTGLAAKDGTKVLQAVVDPVGLRRSAGKTECHLLADRNQFYLLINHKMDNPAKPNVLPECGLRSIPVNGDVYAYDNVTQKMRWRAEVKQGMFVLQDWQDLPFLLFTSRYSVAQKARDGVDNGEFTAVQIFQKKNGKRVYDEVDSLDRQRFSTLQVDWRNQRAELTSENMRIIVQPTR